MEDKTVGLSQNEKVLHMLSGGRDSFLAAAILLEQNYAVFLATFDNGCMEHVERVITVAGWLAERFPGHVVNYLPVVKTGMTFHRYMEQDWYRTSDERSRKFHTLQTYQTHCLACRTAMYVHAIAYCKAHGIRYLSEGARESQGFFVELPEMKQRYQRLCEENGIELLWPVFEIESDFRRKSELHERGLSTKTLEPQCFLGCPLLSELTEAEKEDLGRFYDTCLLPMLQKDIDRLVPSKRSIPEDTLRETGNPQSRI